VQRLFDGNPKAKAKIKCNTAKNNNRRKSQMTDKNVEVLSREANKYNLRKEIACYLAEVMKVIVYFVRGLI
jgi:hypothetical protein